MREQFAEEASVRRRIILARTLLSITSKAQSLMIRCISSTLMFIQMKVLKGLREFLAVRRHVTGLSRSFFENRRLFVCFDNEPNNNCKLHHLDYVDADDILGSISHEYGCSDAIRVEAVNERLEVQVDGAERLGRLFDCGLDRLSFLILVMQTFLFFL